MKRSFNILIPVLLFLLTYACIPISELKDLKETIALENKIDFSSGEFKNEAANYGYEFSLLRQLNKKSSKKDTIVNWRNLTIRLSRINDRLQVNAFDNGILVYSKSVKGKWKDQYFSPKRIIIPIGIPIIWFSYYEKKSFYYWTDSELIISDIELDAGMFLLIFNAGFTDVWRNRYKKIN